MDDDTVEMDDHREAGVYFAGMPVDTLDVLQCAGEVLDMMPSHMEFEIDFQRQGSPSVLDIVDLIATFVQVGHDSVAVEGVLNDQPY